MKDKFSYNKKISMIEHIENMDIRVLKSLAHDEDKEIRCRVAEELVKFPSEETDKILFSLLDDEDLMVRVNACDSLCASNSLEAIKKLKYKLKGEKYLVRGYAVCSIADITKNIGLNPKEIISFLEMQLKKEKSKWVRANYHCALYSLGASEYYSKIVDDALNDKDYHIRCLAINALNEILNDKNVKDIKTALEKRLKIEKAYCVTVELQGLLQRISEN